MKIQLGSEKKGKGKNTLETGRAGKINAVKTFQDQFIEESECHSNTLSFIGQENFLENWCLCGTPDFQIMLNNGQK